MPSNEIHCFIDDAEADLIECTRNVQAEAEPTQATSEKKKLEASINTDQEEFSIPFNSRVVTIIVMSGKITEKIYLTPEGKRVSLKSDNL